MLIFSPRPHPTNKAVQLPALETELVPPDISEYAMRLPPGKNRAGGGGGGGDRSPLPATKGQAPKFMLTQIVPPALWRIANPRLVVEASLLGPPELQFPSPNLNLYGDPFASMVNNSG